MNTPSPDYGEPWRANSKAYAINKHNEVVADCWESATGDCVQNTHRIIACVNACAGIPDPAAHLAKLDDAIELLRRVSTSAATPNDAWEWLKQHTLDK